MSTTHSKSQRLKQLEQERLRSSTTSSSRDVSFRVQPNTSYSSSVYNPTPNITKGVDGGYHKDEAGSSKSGYTGYTGSSPFGGARSKYRSEKQVEIEEVKEKKRDRKAKKEMEREEKLKGLSQNRSHVQIQSGGGKVEVGFDGGNRKNVGDKEGKGNVRNGNGVGVKQGKGYHQKLDAWTRLLESEKSARAKYYETPRSLLLMLEEERTKSLQLETELRDLQNELVQTKLSHDETLSTLQQQHDHDIRNLQQSLYDKSSECTSLTKKLGSATTKHADDVLIWSNRTEKLDSQVSKLQATLSETEKRLEKSEKVILELSSQRKSLQEKVNSRETELKKYIQLSKERESDWISEKESRMKLEVKILELEHYLSSRSDEISDLRTLLAKKENEVKELNVLRSQIDGLKNGLRDMESKERNYIDSIDSCESEIRNLNNQIESISLHNLKLTNDNQLFRNREANHLSEIQSLNRTNSVLRSQISELLSNIDTLNHDLAESSTKQKEKVSEIQNLQNELVKVKELLTDTTNSFNNVSESLSNLESDHAKLKSEFDETQGQLESANATLNQRNAKINTLNQTLSNLKSEVQNLQSHNSDLSNQLHDKSLEFVNSQTLANSLQAEVKLLTSQVTDQKELISKYKIRVEASSKTDKRVTELQIKLEELTNELLSSQDELKKFVSKETKLREMMLTKDLTISELNSKVSNLTSKINQISSSETETYDSLGRVKSELQLIKNQRDEGAQKLQESEIKIDKLNKKINGLQNRMEDLERENESLHGTVIKVQNNLKVQILKNEGLKSTIMVLQDELESYRNSNISDAKKLSEERNENGKATAKEMDKFKEKVNTVTSKLRSQIAELVEKEKNVRNVVVTGFDEQEHVGSANGNEVYNHLMDRDLRERKSQGSEYESQRRQSSPSRGRGKSVESKPREYNPEAKNRISQNIDPSYPQNYDILNRSLPIPSDSAPSINPTQHSSFTNYTYTSPSKIQVPSPIRPTSILKNKLDSSPYSNSGSFVKPQSISNSAVPKSYQEEDEFGSSISFGQFRFDDFDASNGVNKIETETDYSSRGDAKRDVSQRNVNVGRARKVWVS